MCQLMQVLCCDWVLEVRAGVWEASGSNPAPPTQLRAFQRDLHSLRRLSQSLPVSIVFFIMCTLLLLAVTVKENIVNLIGMLEFHILFKYIMKSSMREMAFGLNLFVGGNPGPAVGG